MTGYWLKTTAYWVLTLIQPVGLVWLGLIVLTVVSLRNRRWRSAALAAALVAFILLFGGTNFPDTLLRTLEARYYDVKIADLPACDAIVQLGGATQPSPREAGGVHFTFGGDRVLMALELARLGKAPVLCFSGGFAPEGSTYGHEADAVKNAVLERGLTAAEVLSLGGSLDTHDEALKVQRLAQERGWRRVLLVTSAFHMPRSAATFRSAGVEVVPAPCNFLTDHWGPKRALYLPTFDGFMLTSIWLHEKVGWLEYRRRGWIRTDATGSGSSSETKAAALLVPATFRADSDHSGLAGQTDVDLAEKKTGHETR
jgi:uncharacterized SAM-binding protein YcdF (DUF218 family)